MRVHQRQRTRIKPRRKSLQVRERDIAQLFASALGKYDNLADNLMGVSKCHAALHEVFREVGRAQRIRLQQE